MGSFIFSRRSYCSLLAAQFFGAINDNLLKVYVSLVAVNQLVEGEGGKGSVILAGVLFVLPYLLFSPLAGSCADRFPKSSVLKTAKFVEVLVMLLVVFFLSHQSMQGLFGALFLIGVHSAFFSPSKYGVLPELLPEEELSQGNGFLEMGTFLGSILGTALAGFLKATTAAGSTMPGYVMLGLSVVGLLASLSIERTKPADDTAKLQFSPFAVRSILSEIRGERYLFLVLLALGYFWSLAALYQLNLQLYAKELSHLDDLSTSLLLAVLGTGIGIGSVFAGRVSGGKVELGLVPIGVGGISVASFLLAGSYHHYFLTLLLLAVLGISSGFFVVPLNSFFQQSSRPEARGSYIAASNFCAYVGMLFAYVVLYVGTDLLGGSPAQMLFVVGLTALVVTVYVCRLMPGMLVRCVNFLVAHTLYRVRVIGQENIPKEGGALLICNHVAYADPPILLASIGRPIRFMMYRPIYEAPGIHRIAKILRAIPVDATASPKETIRSLQEARQAIQNGEIVCIFAEGELTRLGHMLSFRKGFEVVMKGVQAPIIPIYLDQIWGSIFSHRDGRFFWKFPKQLPYPVTLAFGKPLPAQSKAQEVRQKIQEMAAELAKERNRKYSTLQSSFLHTAKQRLFAACLSDSTGQNLNYLATAVAALCYREKLKPLLGEKKMVGVILPPSVPGALMNIALCLSGKVSVNLNFTAARDSLLSALKQCDIGTILTSRKFLEKLNFEPLPGMVFLEDLPPIDRQIQMKNALLFLLLPQKMLERLVLRDRTVREDLATVIFSSGSTSAPKGVMLTHGNICSNIESLYELFQLEKRDVLLGCLPLFHSFGYTGTLWLPLLSGIKAVYHPSPMDAQIIGELAEREKATVFMSTPTFLLGYIRKCTKENFQNLRYVVVGAEKLKDRIAQSFQEKFGVMPMEGYGCTELSPVACMNVPDFKDTVVSQIGHKPGTVGHPIPGVAARVVDPDSFAILPPNAEGLLLIHGPNVMKGYLGNESLTQEVLRDGWYVTGDIAKVDDDGFVTITDRLTRFSKIAGEMVPHVKIEEAIHTALSETETVCAVTAVADEKKGEKLVVLTTREFDPSDVNKRLADSGIPNLWIPKKENYHRIPTLPYLGSGKLDLKELKRLAAEFSSSNSA